jgi:hypothetical protein
VVVVAGLLGGFPHVVPLVFGERFTATASCLSGAQGAGGLGPLYVLGQHVRGEGL